MSEKSILDRLQVKPGRTILVIDPPLGYLENLGEIPVGANVVQELQPALIVQVFIRTWLDPDRRD